MSKYNVKIEKILKTTNTDHHQYSKYCRCLRMCGGVENVEAEVVEAVHWTMNRHSASAQSSYTWSTSFAPWIAFTASTASYPSRVAPATPCTSCRPHRAAFALILLVHAPDLGCPLHRS